MSSSETSGVIVSITEQKVNSYSNMLISVFLKSLILQLLHLFCLCVPSQTHPKDQKPHIQHASYTFPLWATNTLPSSSPQTVSETNLNPSVSLYPPCLVRGCICLVRVSVCLIHQSYGNIKTNYGGKICQSFGSACTFLTIRFQRLGFVWQSLFKLEILLYLVLSESGTLWRHINESTN